MFTNTEQRDGNLRAVIDVALQRDGFVIGFTFAAADSTDGNVPALLDIICSFQFGNILVVYIGVICGFPLRLLN